VEYLSAGSKKIYYNASASYRPLRNPLLHLWLSILQGYMIPYFWDEMKTCIWHPFRSGLSFILYPTI
jgi:hypothetical protein